MSRNGTISIEMNGFPVVLRTLSAALFCLSVIGASTALSASCRVVTAEERAHSSQYYGNEQYRVVNIVPGPHGGKLVTIRRWNPKSDWVRSAEGKIYENTQGGDPRWFKRLMPEEISDFLGFKFFGKEGQELKSHQYNEAYEIQIPDHEAINASLAKINDRLLKKGIFGMPFQFIPARDVVSSQDFLGLFFDLNSLPFSVDLVPFHDLNYHLLPLFMIDRTMHQLNLNKTEIVLRFAKWLKTEHPGLASETVLQQIYYIRANELDLFANVMDFLRDRDLGVLDPNDKITALSHRAFRRFIGYDVSAVEYLEYYILNELKPLGVIPKSVLAEFKRSIRTHAWFFASPQNLYGFTQEEANLPEHAAERMLRRVEQIRRALVQGM